MNDQCRPTISFWNRLEGRPRTHNFDRALNAEIRDPLWMLCKQWQLGEFIGDDAGSAITAKMHVHKSLLSKYQADDAQATEFQHDIPLEVVVENQKIPFSLNKTDISLDIRLLMGRQWLKFIADFGDDTKSEYIKNYPIELPDIESATTDKDQISQTYAHLEVWQELAAVSGRKMDGYKFYEHLKNGEDPLEGITTTTDSVSISALALKYLEWFNQLYFQPDFNAATNPSWNSAKLEHAFSCSTPTDNSSKEKVFKANEYYHGHLDWYNLEIDPDASALSTTPISNEKITKKHPYLHTRPNHLSWHA